MTKKKTPSPRPEDPKRQGLEYLHRMYLDRFHDVFSAGNEAGLYDALCYCREYSTPLPKWALDAIIIRERELLFGENNKRHAEWQRRFRQDMVDLARFETVEQCIEHGVKGKDRIFEVASRALVGTMDAGQPSTIRESYRRFMRRQKENPLRYYLPRFIPVIELRRGPCSGPAPGGGTWFDLPESRTLGKLRPRRAPVDSRFDVRLLCPPWDPKLLQ